MPTKTNFRKKKTKQSVKALVKNQLTALSETKMRNASLLSTNFSTIGNEWINIPLTNIALGTEYYQRIGAKILLKSIEFKGVLVGGANESAFDDPYNVIRIVLSRWDGETITPFSTTLGHTIHIPINRTIASCPGMKSKYYDKYIAMNVSSPEKGAGDGYAASARVISFKKVFNKGIPIVYNASSASEKFFLSMISDSAAVPNPGFVTGYCMITWKDM